MLLTFSSTRVLVNLCKYKTLNVFFLDNVIWHLGLLDNDSSPRKLEKFFNLAKILAMEKFDAASLFKLDVELYTFGL